jgi:hypothetical protein
MAMPTTLIEAIAAETESQRVRATGDRKLSGSWFIGLDPGHVVRSAGGAGEGGLPVKHRAFGVNMAQEPNAAVTAAAATN